MYKAYVKELMYCSEHPLLSPILDRMVENFRKNHGKETSKHTWTMHAAYYYYPQLHHTIKCRLETIRKAYLEKNCPPY